MDKLYLKVAKKAKKSGVKVIAGLDTKWEGSLKQRIASIMSIYLVKPYFSHILVAGIYQFEYAKKLGYSNEEILYPEYSADVDLFNNYFKKNNQPRSINYPKNIIYVGRLVREKGIEILLKSFEKLRISYPELKLKLIGNGELESMCKGIENVNVKGFLLPHQIIDEFEGYGIFCLPSFNEPWGVVVHEFAAAGFPMVTARNCGAATIFVRDSYNGFLFTSGSSDDLYVKLKRLVELDNNQLVQFSVRSYNISKSINPTIWASTFISLSGS
jgi:glycosyltransferase involved in cell wall biosynthesis